MDALAGRKTSWRLAVSLGNTLECLLLWYGGKVCRLEACSNLSQGIDVACGIVAKEVALIGKDIAKEVALLDSSQ
jgi:hypothetical protein